MYAFFFIRVASYSVTKSCLKISISREHRLKKQSDEQTGESPLLRIRENEMEY